MRVSCPGSDDVVRAERVDRDQNDVRTRDARERLRRGRPSAGRNRAQEDEKNCPEDPSRGPAPAPFLPDARNHFMLFKMSLTVSASFPFGSSCMYF